MNTFIIKMFLQLLCAAWLVAIAGLMWGEITLWWSIPVYITLKFFVRLEKFTVVQKIDGKETIV